MQYRTTVNGVAVAIDLPRVTQRVLNRVGAFFDEVLRQPAVKNRDAIRDAYLEALRTCPAANASDLWHHVVYRQYCSIFAKHRPQNPNQSWVRASGEALELAVEEWYTAVLSDHHIRIQMLIGRPRKLEALTAMRINNVVGADKLDVALYLAGTNEIFGGVHVKASLAERVSDDVPCSRAMMQNGYFSPLWTLDVKSFPPPQGDLVNRGELGTPENPSAKRRYVEEHGDFDHLYSANDRSVPSGDRTTSGKKVIRLQLSRQPDLFAQEVIARAELFRKKKKAASPPPPR